MPLAHLRSDLLPRDFSFQFLRDVEILLRAIRAPS